MLGSMSHPYALEGLSDKASPLASRHSTIGQRQLNVFIDRQVPDQIETLKDKTDFAIANSSTFRKRKISNFTTLEGIASVGRRIKQTQNGKKSRLSATRRTGDRNVFP